MAGEELPERGGMKTFFLAESTIGANFGKIFLRMTSGKFGKMENVRIPGGHESAEILPEGICQTAIATSLPPFAVFDVFCV